MIGDFNDDLNSPFFLTRFKAALNHYAAFLATLEKAAGQKHATERHMFEEKILGRDIINVVACEGLDRLVRIETWEKWQLRMRHVGFRETTITPECWTYCLNLASGWPSFCKVEVQSNSLRIQVASSVRMIVHAWQV